MGEIADIYHEMIKDAELWKNEAAPDTTPIVVMKNGHIISRKTIACIESLN